VSVLGPAQRACGGGACAQRVRGAAVVRAPAGARLPRTCFLPGVRRHGLRARPTVLSPAASAAVAARVCTESTAVTRCGYAPQDKLLAHARNARCRITAAVAGLAGGRCGAGSLGRCHSGRNTEGCGRVRVDTAFAHLSCALHKVCADEAEQSRACAPQSSVPGGRPRPRGRTHARVSTS
jgi:hypothetical protein